MKNAEDNDDPFKDLVSQERLNESEELVQRVRTEMYMKKRSIAQSHEHLIREYDERGVFSHEKNMQRVNSMVVARLSDVNVKKLELQVQKAIDWEKSISTEEADRFVERKLDEMQQREIERIASRKVPTTSKEIARSDAEGYIAALERSMKADTLPPRHVLYGTDTPSSQVKKRGAMKAVRAAVSLAAGARSQSREKSTEQQQPAANNSRINTPFSFANADSPFSWMQKSGLSTPQNIQRRKSIVKSMTPQQRQARRVSMAVAALSSAVEEQRQKTAESKPMVDPDAVLIMDKDAEYQLAGTNARVIVDKEKDQEILTSIPKLDYTMSELMEKYVEQSEDKEAQAVAKKRAMASVFNKLRTSLQNQRRPSIVPITELDWTIKMDLKDAAKMANKPTGSLQIRKDKAMERTVVTPDGRLQTMYLREIQPEIVREELDEFEEKMFESQRQRLSSAHSTGSSKRQGEDESLRYLITPVQHDPNADDDEFPLSDAHGNPKRNPQQQYRQKMEEVCDLLERSIILLCHDYAQNWGTGKHMTQDARQKKKNALLRIQFLVNESSPGFHENDTLSVVSASLKIHAARELLIQCLVALPVTYSERSKRTWIKAAETLFLLDMACDSVFSTHMEEHIELLAIYFATMYSYNEHTLVQLLTSYRDQFISGFANKYDEYFAENPDAVERRAAGPRRALITSWKKETINKVLPQFNAEEELSRIGAAAQRMQRYNHNFPSSGPFTSPVSQHRASFSANLSFVSFKNKEDDEKRIKILRFKKLMRIMYTYVSISSSGTQALFKKYAIEELKRQEEVFQSQRRKPLLAMDLVEEARLQQMAFREFLNEYFNVQDSIDKIMGELVTKAEQIVREKIARLKKHNVFNAGHTVMGVDPYDDQPTKDAAKTTTESSSEQKLADKQEDEEFDDAHEVKLALAEFDEVAPDLIQKTIRQNKLPLDENGHLDVHALMQELRAARDKIIQKRLAVHQSRKEISYKSKLRSKGIDVDKPEQRELPDANDGVSTPSPSRKTNNKDYTANVIQKQEDMILKLKLDEIDGQKAQATAPDSLTVWPTTRSDKIKQARLTRNEEEEAQFDPVQVLSPDATKQQILGETRKDNSKTKKVLRNRTNQEEQARLQQKHQRQQQVITSVQEPRVIIERQNQRSRPSLSVATSTSDDEPRIRSVSMLSDPGGSVPATLSIQHEEFRDQDEFGEEQEYEDDDQDDRLSRVSTRSTSKSSVDFEQPQKSSTPDISALRIKRPSSRVSADIEASARYRRSQTSLGLSNVSGSLARVQSREQEKEQPRAVSSLSIYWKKPRNLPADYRASTSSSDGPKDSAMVLRAYETRLLHSELFTIFDALKIENDAKVDLTRKYTSSKMSDKKLKSVITVWRSAMETILNREAHLAVCREFEQLASNPIGYIRMKERGIAKQRIIQEKERKQLLAQLSVLTKRCEQAIQNVKKQTGDEVLLYDEIYAEKMKNDYSRMLKDIEAKRLEQALGSYSYDIMFSDLPNDTETEDDEPEGAISARGDAASMAGNVSAAGPATGY